MPREIIHVLTEQQSAVLAPELQKLGEVEQAVGAQRKRCLDMLSLIEPKITDPLSGLHFDAKTLQIYRTTGAEVEADA